MPQTTDQPTIAPCPFCGGAAYRQEVIEHYPASADGPAGSYSAWFHIGCNVCGIEVGGEYESEAEAAWNRRAVPLVAEAPPGMMLVPDWKGYALLGTGRYCLENSAAPPDPELGAELIIRPATDKDKAGNRKIGEERDTDGGLIQPEDMAIRIGFLTPEALDALESQLRHLRRENFPESVAALPASLAPMPEEMGDAAIERLAGEYIAEDWMPDRYYRNMNVTAFARALLSHLRTAPIPTMSDDLEEMRARKDAAYEERNKVVAALARLFPSGIAKTAIEGWSDGWHGCVYIDLPTGQVSWHFHDSQAYLFDGLPPYTGTWDGHDTPEKYRRLALLAASASPQQPEQKTDSFHLAANRESAVQCLDAADGVMVTHCPWCAAPVSVADEPYCANVDCRWNNGGSAPAGVMASDALDTRRYRFLRDVAHPDSNGGLRCVGNCADGVAPLHISGRDLDRAVDAASVAFKSDSETDRAAMTSTTEKEPK
jgi:hypothetical protein